MKRLRQFCFVLLCVGWPHALMGEKRAIVIGASAGMGREVAKRLAAEGYTLGLVARRVHLLESLQEEIGTSSYIKCIDVTEPLAREKLQELIDQMGTVDMVIISISAYLDNRDAASEDEDEYRPEASWKELERYLDVDCKGFIAMAEVALSCFRQQGYGHLVGVSSTSGLRGVWYSPVYAGAKACISTYMQGVRSSLVQEQLCDIFVTDVVPGYVAVEHSPLGDDPSAYWEIPVQEAGECIMTGIRNKQKVVYVSWRVLFPALLLKYLPDVLYDHYFTWL